MEIHFKQDFAFFQFCTYLFFLFAAAALVNAASWDEQSGVDLTIIDINKTSSAPNSGGFLRSYSINGQEQPQLNLTAGVVYTFLTTGLNSAYPVYITTDVSGQNASEITLGLVPNNPSLSINNTYAAAGNRLRWIPQDSQVSSALKPGLSYYYQSRFQSKMGWKIVVNPLTMCQVLGREYLGEYYDVMTAYTSAGINGMLSNNQLKPFYQGLYAGTYNYSTNTTARNGLIDKYVTFLAGSNAFDCKDSSITAYTGRTLSEIHRNLPIDQTAWNQWTGLWNITSQSVYPSSNHNFRREFAPFQPQVCSQCRNSICDIYSSLSVGTSGSGENLLWLTNVVSDAFANMMVSGSTIASYFDGTIPLSFPYASNGTALTYLISKYVQYLGQVSRLNCSNNGFPAYTATNGLTLAQIHQKLPIGLLAFQTANTYLLQSFNKFGVHPTDQARIAAMLVADTSSVCNSYDCGNTAVEAVYVLTSALKDQTNPWYGIGFSYGYVVDGVQGRELFLTVNKTYVFHNNADCTHPLYISTSIDGPTSKGTSNVTLGVSGPPVQYVCAGRELTFTPQASQKGTQFYYQCL